MKQHNVLITGASSGIGLEMAYLFAKNSHSLVLVARNLESLLKISQNIKTQFKSSVHVISKDLSHPNSAREIFDELKQENIPIDILVNNAGVGNNGPFYTTDLQYELSEIQLNVSSLVSLTKMFLPDMVERKFGKILNVASTAAFQPGPFMAVYYATKAFVLSFSQAIASELEGTGVSVTTLCPGPTSTNFDETAGVGDKPLFKSGVMSAKAVAEHGYNALMSDKLVEIPGFGNWFKAFLVRFLPTKVLLNAVKKMQE